LTNRMPMSNSSPLISIIVRTRNEERWIAKCLNGIARQTEQSVEVILVDNGSTDRTVARARAVRPDIAVVTIDRFRPGLAINEGVRESLGRYVVCISAHCPPASNTWLENLLRNFDDPSVAGVYGRQIPLEFTSPADKRDLLLTFGMDRKVQERDTFFHNANSMIRRDVWDRFPFDEEVSNIEDRVWAKKVLEEGYCIVYEPDAPVYHHHGIHQGGEPERCENVVRIMEDLDLHSHPGVDDPLDPHGLETVAVIPIRGGEFNGSEVDDSRALIGRTIRSAREADCVKRVIVASDSEDLAAVAREFGAETPFLRPTRLSEPGVRVDDVLRWVLERLEEDEGYFPDLMIPLEVTYPFRPDGLLDQLTQELLQEGFDTVIAGVAEHRPCWIKDDSGIQPITLYTTQREERKTVHVGLISLGCVTYPEYIRNGSRLGERVGILEIDDPVGAIEVRDRATLEQVGKLLSLRTQARNPSAAVPSSSAR